MNHPNKVGVNAPPFGCVGVDGLKGRNGHKREPRLKCNDRLIRELASLNKIACGIPVQY